MKLGSKQVLASLALSIGLSAQGVIADQGFAPNRSYADPAAPAATAGVMTADPSFAPNRSYADPAAPPANEKPAVPGFSPKKSYADPAAPAS
jgi:hypothetical protein